MPAGVVERDRPVVMLRDLQRRPRPREMNRNELPVRALEVALVQRTHVRDPRNQHHRSEQQGDEQPPHVFAEERAAGAALEGAPTARSRQKEQERDGPLVDEAPVDTDRQRRLGVPDARLGTDAEDVGDVTEEDGQYREDAQPVDRMNAGRCLRRTHRVGQSERTGSR